MKNLKLLIVSIHIKESPQAMPLAAALLKAQLDSVSEIKKNVETSLHEYYLENSAEYIAEKTCEISPNIIGFSTYLWNNQLVTKVCSIIKTNFPDIILFAGGAEATALPVKLLKSAPFDFVIKGEGELVLTEVIKNILTEKDYNTVPGVFAKGELNENKDSQNPVSNLNDIPSPYLTGIIDIKKYSGLLWELSRGCPFKCSFCFESRNVAGVRELSLDRLQKELELFELNKVTQIFVLDPTFNRNVTRVKKILQMIIKTTPQIHFIFEVRTEFIDREMVKLFSMLNCSLQIGLQSAIPEILSTVNRKFDPDKYIEKISMLNYSGIIFGLDLIYGLPGDTIDGFKYSLDYALSLQPNHLDIFPLAVLPGTELYENAKSFNLNYNQNPPYTLISSPTFFEHNMNEANSLKNSCDIFYNKGGATGWMFMITETLEINPSTLLTDFANYLSSNNITNVENDEITLAQSSFVKILFDKYNQSELFPVMDDIIKFNGIMNSSLYEGPLNKNVITTFNENSIFKISSATRFLILKYNFDALLTVGEYTLEEFLQYNEPEKTSLIIYNYYGEVKSLSVDENSVKLLQSFNGKFSLQNILEENQSYKREDLNEFIEYALTETIIYI